MPCLSNLPHLISIIIWLSLDSRPGTVCIFQDRSSELRHEEAVLGPSEPTDLDAGDRFRTLSGQPPIASSLN
ncbi:hypothetical protein F5B21DRAFT_137177 [Xylaria acuta]|nr:hypothetical protein F5B21DRAFT_137177 [Xylaria acuta]